MLDRLMRWVLGERCPVCGSSKMSIRRGTFYHPKALTEPLKFSGFEWEECNACGAVIPSIELAERIEFMAG